MNLLCITKGPMYGAPVRDHWAIQFGEVYEAVSEYIDPVWGKYYTLAHDINYGYAEEHFVVLPSDEELAAEEEGAELDQAFRDLVQEIEKV